MCPPCKIILDEGGAIPAAAAGLAQMSEAAARAILHGVEIGSINEEQLDEAHAFSELLCHRAALMRQWTEEIRTFTTKLIGGEYQGNFIVDGVDGIRRKENP